MADPLVSVVTPSYNQAEYIEDTLTSVKRQHYETIEHVVIDGESTDGTLEILQKYEDQYDLRWTSEPDDGQSDAINTGFDRVTGDIVGWLNSDDVYLDPDVFTRVIDHFERTDADVIYGDLVTIDGDSTVIGVDLRPDFRYRHLLVRTLIGQPAVFFKASVITDERLDTSLDYTMDYEFWLRLAREYEFRHVRDLMAGFRRHSDQKTESQDRMRQEARETAAQFGTASVDLGLMLDLSVAEVERLVRSIVACVRLSRSPPPLAFDGRTASLPRLLSSVFPATADVGKFLERW